jgi:hypothetical protein
MGGVGSGPPARGTAVDAFPVHIGVGRWLAFATGSRFELGDAVDLVERDADLDTVHGLDDEQVVLLGVMGSVSGVRQLVPTPPSTLTTF